MCIQIGKYQKLIVIKGRKIFGVKLMSLEGYFIGTLRKDFHVPLWVNMNMAQETSWARNKFLGWNLKE
jgi:hypothetical protein